MPKCLREWIICLASFAWEGEYSGSSPEILCLGVVVLMVCSLQEIGGGPWSFSLGLLYRLLPVDSVLKTFMFILACNTGCSSMFEEVLLNPPFCDKWRILFFCHFVDILLERNSRILKKVERSSEELLEAIWFNSSLWVSAWHHLLGFVFVISFGVFFLLLCLFFCMPCISFHISPWMLDFLLKKKFTNAHLVIFLLTNHAVNCTFLPLQDCSLPTPVHTVPTSLLSFIPSIINVMNWVYQSQGVLMDLGLGSLISMDRQFIVLWL